MGPGHSYTGEALLPGCSDSATAKTLLAVWPPQCSYGLVPRKVWTCGFTLSVDKIHGSSNTILVLRTSTNIRVLIVLQSFKTGDAPCISHPRRPRRVSRAHRACSAGRRPERARRAGWARLTLTRTPPRLASTARRASMRRPGSSCAGSVRPVQHYYDLGLIFELPPRLE